MRDMTAKEAIRQLEDMKHYCTAQAIPALDYAIDAMKEKAEREKEYANPRPSRGFSISGSNSG